MTAQDDPVRWGILGASRIADGAILPGLKKSSAGNALAIAARDLTRAKALADSTSLRRTALLYHIPYYTTLQGAMAVTRAIEAVRADSLKVAPLQSYVSEQN